MKKLIVLLASLALFCGFGFCQDPAVGFWKSIDEKTNEATALWKIYEEGGKLYGKIIEAPKADGNTLADKCKESYKGFPVEGKVNKMKLLGTPFIFGLSKISDGKWEKGSIIDPNDGKMYACSITIHEADGGKFKETTLEMRGSLGPFGRSQFWKKSGQ